MNVSVVKTPLVVNGDSLTSVISKSIDSLTEKSVLVIASKIVSFCEGRLVPKIANSKEERQEIVKRETDYYVEPHFSQYRIMLTRHMGKLMIDAGVDVSNADNKYALLPKDPQKTVNDVWEFLKEHYKVASVGVIMVDSFPSLPLVWGTVGMPLSYCGFVNLSDYKGKKDLYGWEMHFPIINKAQGMAAAAGLEMGEGDEQTPLAIVTGVKKLEFVDRVPTEKEIKAERVKLKDDLFAPFLTAVEWKKGRR